MERACIFCKVIAGEIPGTPVYEDDDIVALVDVQPQAPEHILVLPRQHYADIADFSERAKSGVVARLFSIAARIGKERGPEGFRLVVNTGEEGGQTVPHLHVHVLAGRRMTWPPG